MDNSPLGPTRVDNGPLQGPRSCQQLDKDMERAAAIEKCGPARIDNLQESERYAGVLLQARYQLAKAQLENNPYPLPEAFLAFLFILSSKPTASRASSWERLLF